MGNGSRPRLECSPSLTFGLGTASPISSAEKIGSGVRLSFLGQQNKNPHLAMGIFLWLSG
jgi:hypothetical protein